MCPRFQAVALHQILFVCLFAKCLSSEAAVRLFDDLLRNYNKLVRPVSSDGELVTVFMRLRLSQIIDVHEKDQIVTSNMWLRQEWTDHKLTWDPEKYNRIKYIYVPAEMLWLPDIVLYNNADGNYQVTKLTKATVWYTGKVSWEPPAIYKSMCEMNLEYFPFDEQTCSMKFGVWSYYGNQVDLVHWQGENVNISLDSNGDKVWIVDQAIELTGYYESVEWDVMAVPGKRHSLLYPCCDAPFIDITYELQLRRKPLFYTVNLIVPCVGISFLTLLVFYLPADSGEKISLCISVLISLTVFFLLLIELIPSTSLVIPLIGKYLLFTMCLVTGSVIITVLTLNIHYRSPTNNPTMPGWMRTWFLFRIPRILWMTPLTEMSTRWDRTMYESALGDPVEGIRPRRRNRGLHKADRKKLVVPQPNPRQSMPNLRDYLPTTKSRAKSVDLWHLSNKPRVLQNYGIQENSPPTLTSATTTGNEARSMTSIAERRRKPARLPIDPARLRRLADCVSFIADKIRREELETRIAVEWKFVAMVIDQFFLYIFSIVCLLGTMGIILEAPSLRDTRPGLRPTNPRTMATEF